MEYWTPRSVRRARNEVCWPKADSLQYRGKIKIARDPRSTREDQTPKEGEDDPKNRSSNTGFAQRKPMKRRSGKMPTPAPRRATNAY